jgi:hypothetical protein
VKELRVHWERTEPLQGYHETKTDLSHYPGTNRIKLKLIMITVHCIILAWYLLNREHDVQRAYVSAIITQ